MWRPTTPAARSSVELLGRGRAALIRTQPALQRRCSARASLADLQPRDRGESTPACESAPSPAGAAARWAAPPEVRVAGAGRRAVGRWRAEASSPPSEGDGAVHGDRECQPPATSCLLGPPPPRRASRPLVERPERWRENRPARAMALAVDEQATTDNAVGRTRLVQGGGAGRGAATICHRSPPQLSLPPVCFPL